MQIIELDLLPEMSIKCPFCGVSLYDEDGLHECPHLLFHASDFGLGGTQKTQNNLYDLKSL